MRTLLLPCVFAIGALFASASGAACSSSSGSPQATDAGVDAAHVDAGKDGSSFFPGVDSGNQDAAASACDALKAQMEQRGLLARACNPSGQQTCNAATDGPCCSITVSSTNVSAVNDYDQAVKAYKAACTPDCSRVICEQTPSDVCDGAGANGLCH